MANDLILAPSVELIRASNVHALLARVRPQWQAKALIDRVRRLLDVDPSSACQRLLNAAIHDLREKIIIAGIDIATEAAKQSKLPPITNSEDIENYSTLKLIDLAYRMGLLSRSEWRRVSRCYEIRRDLEHEDDEYEAGVEDCVYIFTTCIEVILSKDPVQLIKVTDFKGLIEQPSAVVPDRVFLEDFRNAPQPRQEEILKFLVSHALNKGVADVVQQNAYTCITYLRPVTQAAVSARIGDHLQSIAGRKIDARMARVAHAAGVFPYLRQSARLAFFEEFFGNMEKVGTHWTAHGDHGDLLRSFIDFGGLENCPREIRESILKWLVLTYVGTPGGPTRYGNVRHVFYSNSAAPVIKEIISKSARSIRADLEALRADKHVKEALCNDYISRRFETLIDLVETEGA
ncbi:MAG: hypothetical protein AB7N54_00815 [Alphaproteobacteria bacterium]